MPDDPILDDFPEVQEHAIAAHKAEEAAIAEENARYVDVDGHPFDPSLHVTDASGNPTFTKTGKLRKKTRKKGEPNGHVTTLDGPGPEEKKFHNAANAAHITTKMIEQCGCFFGPEFKYFKDKDTQVDEEAFMFEAWNTYYKAKDVPDIPPGILVAFALTTYVGSRLTVQSTRSKFGAVFGKIWKGFKSLSFKKKEEKKEKE